jgi:hypothetical protein
LNSLGGENLLPVPRFTNHINPLSTYFIRTADLRTDKRLVSRGVDGRSFLPFEVWLPLFVIWWIVWARDRFCAKDNKPFSVDWRDHLNARDRWSQCLVRKTQCLFDIVSRPCAVWARDPFCVQRQQTI